MFFRAFESGNTLFLSFIFSSFHYLLLCSFVVKCFQLTKVTLDPVKMVYKLLFNKTLWINVSTHDLVFWFWLFNFPSIFCLPLKFHLKILHCIKLREYGLSQTRIPPYKDRIYNSVLMQENKGQWKTVFLHILCSVSWKICLIFRMVLLIKVLTAWKMSVFGVFLVRIFPHSDWIRTRESPNTDTFHAVIDYKKYRMFTYLHTCVLFCTDEKCHLKE